MSRQNRTGQPEIKTPARDSEISLEDQYMQLVNSYYNKLVTASRFPMGTDPVTNKECLDMALEKALEKIHSIELFNNLISRAQPLDDSAITLLSGENLKPMPGNFFKPSGTEAGEGEWLPIYILPGSDGDDQKLIPIAAQQEAKSEQIQNQSNPSRNNQNLISTSKRVFFYSNKNREERGSDPSNKTPKP